jgi:hypothetical protein
MGGNNACLVIIKGDNTYEKFNVHVQYLIGEIAHAFINKHSHTTTCYFIFNFYIVHACASLNVGLSRTSNAKSFKALKEVTQ